MTRSKKPSPKADPLPDAKESRGAVAVTVVWMLLTLSCLTAQLVALATWLFARGAGIPAGRPNALLLVPTTLMMVALITGILLVIVNYILPFIFGLDNLVAGSNLFLHLGVIIAIFGMMLAWAL